MHILLAGLVLTTRSCQLINPNGRPDLFPYFQKSSFIVALYPHICIAIFHPLFSDFCGPWSRFHCVLCSILRPFLFCSFKLTICFLRLIQISPKSFHVWQCIFHKIWSCCKHRKYPLSPSLTVSPCTPALLDAPLTGILTFTLSTVDSHLELV